MFDREKLIDDLIVDEGKKAGVYDDKTGRAILPGTLCRGNPTTGIGHALNQTPWTDEQMRTICEWDIDARVPALYAAEPWIANLSEPRQRALANMAFNLGDKGLEGFGNFLSLLREGNYSAAADDLANTLWAKEVGDRAKRIAELIRSG